MGSHLESGWGVVDRSWWLLRKEGGVKLETFCQTCHDSLPLPILKSGRKRLIQMGSCALPGLWKGPGHWPRPQVVAIGCFSPWASTLPSACGHWVEAGGS